MDDAETAAAEALAAIAVIQRLLDGLTGKTVAIDCALPAEPPPRSGLAAHRGDSYTEPVEFAQQLGLRSLVRLTVGAYARPRDRSLPR